MPSKVGGSLHAHDDGLHLLDVGRLQDLVNESIGSQLVIRNLERVQALSALIHELNMVRVQAHVNTNIQFRHSIHPHSEVGVKVSSGPRCPWETTDFSLAISTHPQRGQLRVTTPPLPQAQPAVRTWVVDSGYQAFLSSTNGPQGGTEMSRERLADPIVTQAGRERIDHIRQPLGLPNRIRP